MNIRLLRGRRQEQVCFRSKLFPQILALEVGPVERCELLGHHLYGYILVPGLPYLSVSLMLGSRQCKEIFSAMPFNHAIQVGTNQSRTESSKTIRQNKPHFL